MASSLIRPLHEPRSREGMLPRLEVGDAGEELEGATVELLKAGLDPMPGS